ncbi:MAG TPA: sensor histidine kinase [Solirubrobacteraceae bacterium]|nr:sensor histidine kinase [Solirubrobacteraceae bacterium]
MTDQRNGRTSTRRVPIPSGRETSIAGAVARFAITGLAGLGLLTFLAVQLLSSRGTTEAIRDAKALTQVAGRGIAAPYLTPQLLAGQPEAIRAIDGAVRTRLLAAPVVRVKIWNGTGRIVYSDEPRLIGARYPLGASELHALRTGGVDAEVSDLSRPENRFERQYHKLLEVYYGMRAEDGTPALFELYQRFSSITASGNRVFRTFFVPMIATMVLLELAQIPLAVSLARKVRRGQRDREELLQRAIDASEFERRRIARDLHDGPVQDLAGVSYTLSSAAGEARAVDPELAAALEQTSRQARESIRALRTLLVDIYPPRLHSEGLIAALSDLLSAFTAAGVETMLDADPQLRLPPGVEAVLFRVAQESLRNVLEHAHAKTVNVEVRTPEHHALLEVRDDGCGMDLSAIDEEEHFGLRMLEGLARDSGGRLELESVPGNGTAVRLAMPLD